MSSKRQKMIKTTELIADQKMTDSNLLESVESVNKLSLEDENEASSGSDKESISSATSFTELGVQPWLVAALNSMAIRKPTEIQRACIPPTLQGRTVIGGARTGSGKTAAFAIPILQKLAEDPYGVFAVILTPTRELAFQIADQFDALGKGVNLKLCVTVGGIDMMKQALELARRPHIIVATPGRLADHIQSSSGAVHLTRTQFLVLDEADRLLTPSFASDLNVIMDQLPRNRQTMLYTATLTEAIVALQNTDESSNDNKTSLAVSKKPFVYRCDTGIATVATLRQRYLLVPSSVREVYLALLLRAATIKTNDGDQEQSVDSILDITQINGTNKQKRDRGNKSRSQNDKKRKVTDTDDPLASVTMPELDGIITEARSIIVFCGHCKTAQVLRTMLTGLGISCAALHSMLSQRARLASLSQFKGRQVRVLITTDVGSRGLDIPTVDLVINYDVPQDPADYIHRVGRTARAGRGGAAVTIMSEKDVQLVQAIEERIGIKMDELVVDETAIVDSLKPVSAAKRLAVMEMHDSALGDKEYTRKQKHQVTAKGTSASSLSTSKKSRKIKHKIM
ncbi:P-loop containing nucleoside triphosphate hydrolase protein [Syncephalis fuscata]|nr:P-loop containing nucleoside triphosphate hydrolase protein [Syncephalis fuscata]